MPRSKWIVLTLVALFSIVSAVACRNLDLSAASVEPESAVLTDLESIEQLRAAFNEDAGRPRLLMILAPL